MAKQAPMRETRQRKQMPREYSILLTATMCLLAFGAVMVYSSSSASNLLSGEGDGTGYLIKYVIFGAIGFGVMHLISRVDITKIRDITPVLLAVSFALLLAVLLPGLGVTVNGAQRWLGLGPIQFQPSELVKPAIILYGAALIAQKPSRVQHLRHGMAPLLLVTGTACALVAVEPDLGTALVIAFAVISLLIAAGVPLKQLGMLVGVAALLVTIYAFMEPYRRDRLTAFLDPWADPQGTGFQSVQGQIALGSGGLFGTGLGQSVQKIFYLPEAHTDFILAVIGEEIGVFGVYLLLALYSAIAYAGLRTARNARTLYTRLVAAGITSWIVAQAMLNIFTVLGIAPLTGVPLPFISYGATNLIVLLCGMGILLNIASGRADKLHHKLEEIEKSPPDSVRVSRGDTRSKQPQARRRERSTTGASRSARY